MTVEHDAQRINQDTHKFVAHPDGTEDVKRELRVLRGREPADTPALEEFLAQEPSASGSRC
jgi:hypothetical protein